MKRLNLFNSFSKIVLVLLFGFAMLFAYPLDAQRQKEGTQTQNKQTKQYRYLCKICGGNIIVSYNKEAIDNHKKLCREKNKKNNATKKKK